MSECESARVARAFFDTVDRENLTSAIERHCIAGFTWWALGMGQVEDRVRDFDRIMLSHIDENGVRAIIHGITAQGERVAVELESRATLKDGTVYNNFYHFLLIVRDGQIHEVKEYLDTKLTNNVWNKHFD